ncbi:hypothetical protein PoB_005147600 [Plakobranchus ocellatus]|uniref:Uncharacterized protein n=1 Tax=Plakobranchus ocellatus TaxID=259542 RepID=A0AAV4BNZ0_9GAST|nr:hypothetical protein PoB_005147600 [Plakobranchus ocellatus]
MTDMKRSCSPGPNGVRSIMTFDKTFNLTDVHVTAAVYKNVALLNSRTMEHPGFFGAFFLHGLHETARLKEYMPDFSVRILTDVQYLFITQSDYLSALHATRMLRLSGSNLIEGESDVDRAKSNHNQNSLFSSSSPPPCNSPLYALRDDMNDKKQSTSSLDRLAFFQRKPDPHEILNRMRRTGSDAKDRSEEYHHDPRKHSMDSAHPISFLNPQELALTSPRKLLPDGSTKRPLLSSAQPSKARSNHKLDFLIENNDGNGDNHVSNRTSATEKLHEELQSPPLFPPTAYAAMAEGESSSIASAGASPVTNQGNSLSTAATSMSVHEHPSAGDTEAIGAGDSERIPLMQMEKKTLADKTPPQNL